MGTYVGGVLSMPYSTKSDACTLLGVIRHHVPFEETRHLNFLEEGLSRSSCMCVGRTL
jgi:hypothetical protein